MSQRPNLLPAEIDFLYKASQQLVVASTPAEILEAVSGYARAKGAVSATLGYFDDFQAHSMEIVAMWGVSEEYLAPLGMRIEVVARKLPQTSFANSTRPTFVSDMLNSDIVGFDSQRLASSYQVRALVTLPLYSNGRWIAVISFNWKEVYAFNEQDERVYGALQQYAAAAVATIRLFKQSLDRAVELEHTNQELNLLYRASEVINRARSYAEIVEAVAYFDAQADSVMLLLWEHFDWEIATYEEIVVVLDRTESGILQSGMRLMKDDSPIANHIAGQRVWLFKDALTDPQIDSVTAERWTALNIRAFVSLSLYVGSQWIGALTFSSKHPRHYSEREVRLFVAIADLVAAAVERVRSQQETEAARRAAEQFAAQAQQLAALEERNRLARELHDSVSQVLYSISLWGHSARAYLKHDPTKIGESVNYILSLAEVGLAEMRALIFELRPELLEEEGLISALTKQADSIRARHGIEVTIDFYAEPPLPLAIKSDLYRIAREALHNAIKHAQATHISLSFSKHPLGYRLEIRDNGHGFDTSQSFPGHLGLKSMRERTAALNGSLQIESTVGAGTSITLNLPAEPPPIDK